MNRQEATARLRLVRSRHKPIPRSGGDPQAPRCVRDGVRLHRDKRGAYQHDRGEIGALSAAADHGYPKVK